jgi:hypothetical protein
MIETSIPLTAYFFIGAASLVLAAVTVMDNDDNVKEIANEKQEEQSFTTMLPSFNGTTENVPPETITNNEEEPESEKSVLSSIFPENETKEENKPETTETDNTPNEEEKKQEPFNAQPTGGKRRKTGKHKKGGKHNSKKHKKTKRNNKSK